MKHLKLYEQFITKIDSKFTDTKVVGEDGKPLIVYHGSAEKFDVFDKSKIGQNYTYSEDSGFFFTQREQSAKNYARLHTRLKSDGHVYPAYLNIVNPIVRSTNSDYWAPADHFDMHHSELMREVRLGDNIDGIIIKGTRNDNLYIVFEPEQIQLINRT